MQKDISNNMNTSMDQYIALVNNGGVIIYPTDTACGIGCRIDDDEAVRRIYEIKGRDLGKAVPVLCSSLEMVQKYTEPVSAEVEKLMQTYWPGALTIVLKAKTPHVSSLVLGKDNTIGVRIPEDLQIRQLIEKVGVPIVGTSANLAGEPTVFDTKDVTADVRSKVDAMIEGECPKRQSSTVVDITQSPWTILRQGAVELSIEN